ncbi:MAG: hypothetical protein ACYSRZ_09110 [Planctomycetota bacterium]|jgi:hypothetical protein
MKRMIVVLAVLLMAAPAMAAVTITAVDEGGGVVAISFSNDEATGKVRAIALDITVDGSTLITNVTDINTDYDIHPGSIVIDPCDILDPGDGTISDYGSAVCDNSYPGTEAGIGTDGVTIEMATLTASGPQSGLICKVEVDGACNLTVSGNVIRGGIVMEDPGANPNDNMDVIISVAGGCGCPGDIEDDGAGPVNANDLFTLLFDLTGDGIPPAFTIYPTEPGYRLCSDVKDSLDPLGSVITADDLFEMLFYLTPTGGADMGCMPPP